MKIIEMNKDVVMFLISVICPILYTIYSVFYSLKKELYYGINRKYFYNFEYKELIVVIVIFSIIIYFLTDVIKNKSIIETLYSFIMFIYGGILLLIILGMIDLKFISFIIYCSIFLFFIIVFIIVLFKNRSLFNKIIKISNFFLYIIIALLMICIPFFLISNKNIYETIKLNSKDYVIISEYKDNFLISEYENIENNKEITIIKTYDYKLVPITNVNIQIKEFKNIKINKK